MSGGTAMEFNLQLFGGGGRDRTDTRLPSLDFESSASAISPHRHIFFASYQISRDLNLNFNKNINKMIKFS